jgi:hypothetical protein
MGGDPALALDQEMTDPVICQGGNLISHDRLADFAAQSQHRGWLLVTRCGNVGDPHRAGNAQLIVIWLRSCGACKVREGAVLGSIRMSVLSVGATVFHSIQGMESSCGIVGPEYGRTALALWASIKLGDSDRLEVVEFVIAVGNPFGLGVILCRRSRIGQLRTIETIDGKRIIERLEAGSIATPTLPAFLPRTTRDT